MSTAASSPGIDVQLEFLWTVVWAYLAHWTFGAPIVFSRFQGPFWNGPSLFFLLCLGFYELQTGSITNPAYWVKDFVVDEVSERKVRRARADKMLLMGVVDVFGHITGYWLYLKTLEALGETAAIDIVAQPPNFTCGWIWAFIVEAIVTSGTQLSSSITEAFGMTGRLGNLVSSAFSVYVLMIWGLAYTGAVMNPASSIAVASVSQFFAKKHRLSIVVLLKLFTIFVSAPLVGAIGSGIIEGGLVGDRLRREEAREKFE